MISLDKYIGPFFKVASAGGLSYTLWLLIKMILADIRSASFANNV